MRGLGGREGVERACDSSLAIERGRDQDGGRCTYTTGVGQGLPVPCATLEVGEYVAVSTISPQREAQRG